MRVERLKIIEVAQEYENMINGELEAIEMEHMDLEEVHVSFKESLVSNEK